MSYKKIGGHKHSYYIHTYVYTHVHANNIQNLSNLLIYLWLLKLFRQIEANISY